MKTRVLHLRIGRSVLRAETREHGTIAWAGEASYGGVPALADVIARLAAEAPPACRRLRVALERPPLQLRTLTQLPPVKSRHLAALIAQRAGWFFRKNGQPLVTDATWVGKGRPPVARAAAVEEALVEAVAAGARAAGLWLETIAPADDWKSLELLPTSERESRERAARGRTRNIALTAVSIWVACGTLFVTRLAWERRGAERELAALAKPVADVLESRRELRDAEAALNVIAAGAVERGRSLVVLASVANALPDSSVLVSLTWTADGTGVLLGAARHASEVAAKLDRAGPLIGVRLEGPVVQETIAGREWERFTMVFGGATRTTKEEGL